MTNYFKNFIEKSDFWNTKKVIFLDFKKNQEIEFSKDDGIYSIIYTELETDLKKTYKMDKKAFYEKLKTVVENTIFNPENYKLSRYNKLTCLMSVWFNL